MEIRTGDRVAVGVTLRDARGGGPDVVNNDTATVKGFTAGDDPALRLRMDRTGETVTLRASDLVARYSNTSEPLPRLQHGYSSTVHKAQGRRRDFVILHAGGGLDKEGRTWAPRGTSGIW